MRNADVCPLEKLRDWIGEELNSGTSFAHGAILATISSSGHSRSRMLGVHFDNENRPKFHTTPPSRKTDDIRHNTSASLTFGWHKSLRSVCLEGHLTRLEEMELDEDWLALETDFRRSYHVFGSRSGANIGNKQDLESQREKLPLGAEATRPASFIGYKFNSISRVAFYAVGDEAFASSEVFEWDGSSASWDYSQVVP